MATKKPNSSKKSITSKKQKKKQKKKETKKIITVLGIVVIISLLIGIILFSNWFNIKSITVRNNSRVSIEEIISKSELTTDTNIVTALKSGIKRRIKEIAYIEDVKIHKKINGEIIIDVEERIPTYILQTEDKFAYINNQGYILELTQEPLELPELKGYGTKELSIGNRLDVEDLKKLDTVIKISNTAITQGLKDKITAIDITDGTNYILHMPSENKMIEFGDETDAAYKFDCTEEILDKTKNEEGIIIVKDASTKLPYFRPKV